MRIACIERSVIHRVTSRAAATYVPTSQNFWVPLRSALQKVAQDLSAIGVTTEVSGLAATELLRRFMSNDRGPYDAFSLLWNSEPFRDSGKRPDGRNKPAVRKYGLSPLSENVSLNISKSRMKVRSRST